MIWRSWGCVEKAFDETIAGLSFVVEGEEKNIEGTLDFLTGRPRKTRSNARELSRVLPKISKFLRVPIIRGERKGNSGPLAQNALCTGRETFIK